MSNIINYGTNFPIAFGGVLGDYLVKNVIDATSDVLSYQRNRQNVGYLHSQWIILLLNDLSCQ